MQQPKDQETKIVEPEQEEEEEQEMTGKNKTALNQRLIACIKKNQYEEVQKCLKRKADINYQQNNKKKWTGFIWACCLGHTKIVRLMLSKGAANQYLEVKPQYRNVVMGATKQMRPNPLHWASFKGHLEIVQLLLKAGVHWQDIDSCGNNSVMLAAAGNFIEIFKKYLQFGVQLDCKNSRGHTSKDLTTHPQILALINAHDKTLECPISKLPFKQKQIKYWCWVSGKFVSAKHFRNEWSLKDLNAVERQELDGRSSVCWSQAQKMKAQLQEAIGTKQEAHLKKVMNIYRQKFNQIDVVFLEGCSKMLNKLEVQNNILSYVHQLDKVQNYKVILKSVNHIQQMLKEAKPLGIDGQVVAVAEKAIERLNAERNLRFQIDNINTESATRDGVNQLENLYKDAQCKSVAKQYLSVASDIKEKMNRSITVQDIYQMFLDYPPRPDPYPDPLVIDFKTKKPLDPETKKPTDPANLLPKKKKGKKEPKYVIPEWATEIKDLNDKIKQQEELLSRREELGLSPQFCKKVEDIIVVMKRQSRYRKDMDTLQAMVDEANKKKK